MSDNSSGTPTSPVWAYCTMTCTNKKAPDHSGAFTVPNYELVVIPPSVPGTEAESKIRLRNKL